MQDQEVVAAIVAGDPRGVAEAYDRYAMPLYSYCRSLLREPADAADAVQDTFVIATAKLGALRDPGKLRPHRHRSAEHLAVTPTTGWAPGPAMPCCVGRPRLFAGARA